MKKKLLTILISAIAFSTILSGCKDNPAQKLGLTENAYIAETSSGDVIINFDEDGNPIEMIDANGDVIDLTKENVTVEKDENGEVTAITKEDGERIPVKEKANEKNSGKIIAKAEEKQAEKEKSTGKEESTEEVNKEEENKGNAEREKEIEERLGKQDESEKTEPVNEEKPAKGESVVTIDTTDKDKEKKEKKTEEDQPKETPTEKIMYVNPGGDGMRKVYDSYSDGTVIATLVPGLDNAITVIGEHEDWYHIQFKQRGKDIDGWTPKSSLTDNKTETVDDNPEQKPCKSGKTDTKSL